MITRLIGHHLGMDDDGALCLNVLGVGYRVVVHDRDRGVINAAGIAAPVHLFVRSVTKEDGTTLFGFRDAEDRRFFDRVQRVSGCGPSTAMRILSTMTGVEAFGVVKAKRCDPVFATVHGIGEKTALKLGRELKP